MKRGKIAQLVLLAGVVIACSSCSSVSWTQWQEMDSPTTEVLHAVWGFASDDVYAVGNYGTIIHYDGTEWNTMSGTSHHFESVWGASADDVWVVGNDKAVLRRQNGGGWQSYEHQIDKYVHLLDVRGTAADDVWAVGASGWGGTQHGIIWRWADHDGNGTPYWKEMAAAVGPKGASEFNGVWINEVGEVYAVGAHGYSSTIEGMCYKYNGTGWSWQWTGSTPAWPKVRDYKNVWGAGSELFIPAMSYSPWYAEAVHYDGASWHTEVFQNQHSLQDAWGSGPDDVYMVGHYDAIFHFDGVAWSEMVSPTGLYLTSVWGDGAGHVFAVGESGTILHLAPPNQPPVAR